MIKRGGVIFLLGFVLFILFLNWYFLFKNPCEPITKCNMGSINISCTSNNDCFLGSLTGICDMNVFKCVNLVLDGDKEDCSRMGGEWVEWGCLNKNRK